MPTTTTTTTTRATRTRKNATPSNVKNGESLGASADALAAPVRVPSDLKGRDVYKVAQDAGNVARRALAGLPTWARDVEPDAQGHALGPVLGFAPKGRNASAWAILSGPGHVQTVARWALAIIRQKSIALAVPVRRCPTDDGGTVDRMDRVKGHRDGSLTLAPHAGAVDDAGALAPVVGYTPAVAVTKAGADLVTALGIPGVRAGIRPTNARDAIVKWAREWTTTDDDGREQTAHALDDCATVARDLGRERLSEDARRALADGRGIATITKTVKKLSSRAQVRALAAAGRAEVKNWTKAMPIV